ncbi:MULTISPECIES: response regulator [Paenibacillus]|uniref:Chemotaxis protein CheY n=1 Tax=Paenibacillus naphthalenovorans TaxID=162209 RepID=A0A0U2IMT4_9BACL|nr:MULTISPECIES: response regulator transcription factor [Paenibacillus]ALS23323.1 chemotaxis protein CheY [Paenibacillus naphthalenovorans]NTZ17100.1 response regulator transcription factor [Paenibacillus sp. JMULE4]GCL72803.1 DNA-binding response regulator [Paenibacillus naphthalenovorans]SDI09071.1 DNA-binding response regulator, NarL/FixJ family, contains REC and HTH domains [Paenibacillus naphthalenovorans]
MNYRVLIADDHPLARKAVRTLIEGESGFEWIGEARNGQEAVELCGELLPDLVLMDIQMPVMGGLEATKRIKQLYPHIRVVMLTVSDDVADLFTAIRYGAQGYLLKNMDPDDWIAYLHGLLDDDSEISRGMADRLFHSFRSADANVSDVQPGVLSQRECEILSCVASGQSNRQIAETLVITENTVKNHIKNILAKLSLDNRVQLTAYAVRHGLTQIGQKNGRK